MDKRDYFATAAMQGILANPSTDTSMFLDTEKVSKAAYAIAEQMIECSSHEPTN